MVRRRRVGGLGLGGGHFVEWSALGWHMQFQVTLAVSAYTTQWSGDALGPEFTIGPVSIHIGAGMQMGMPLGDQQNMGADAT